MKMLRMKNVLEITGLSRSTVYESIKQGNFPKQIKLGVKAVGWTSDSINEWLESKINQ